MKTLIATLLLVLFTGCAFAQAPVTPPAPALPAALPTDFVFLGAGLNTSVPSNRAVGAFAWGHQISSNMYTFTRADMVGVSKKPFAIQTVLTAGVCDITHQIGAHIFLGGCLDGGTAVEGGNIGGAIGADGLAGYRFGKNGNLAAVVMGGIVKTALSSAVTPIRAGVVYGWGK